MQGQEEDACRGAEEALCVEWLVGRCGGRWGIGGAEGLGQGQRKRAEMGLGGPACVVG